MTLDVDTFLTQVYVTIDTLLQEDPLPLQPGPRPRMSDSEVLTLVVVAQWRGSSERACLRWVETEHAAAFPTRISQSAFNRRARRLGPRCAILMQQLAALLGAASEPYQVLDCTAVPLARQCRGEHHRLFADEAGIGRGGSDRKWFYGVRLLLAVTGNGAITGLVVGAASTQDRWLADALLVWRVHEDGIPWTVEDIPKEFRNGERKVGPTGPRWWPGCVGAYSEGPYLVDDGFIGRAWETHWHADTGAMVHGAPTAVHPRRLHHQRRQMIETVNGLLHEIYHLAFPLAKTMWGVVMRIVAKCTACNLSTWINQQAGLPRTAHKTLVCL